MSIGRRAYDILRGNLNYEFERIGSLFSESAEAELQEALDKPAPATAPEERQEVVELTQEEKARLVLGVSPKAKFEEIKKAYDRLTERCDPSRFADGSTEASQAAEIRTRVDRAFRILSNQFDPTETRFKSLEIE
jgi:DnaJ-domain-containing protein 1